MCPLSKEWSTKIITKKEYLFLCMMVHYHFHCEEKYKVFVFEEIGNIGLTNLKLLKENIGDNTIQIFRGNRKIFYNTGKTIGKNPRRELATNDKFLKCVESGFLEKETRDYKY